MFFNQGFLIKNRKPEGLKIRIEVEENETYAIPTYGYRRGLVVDWGDGIIERYAYKSKGHPQHSYTKAGTYIVHLWGELGFYNSYNYQSQAEREILSIGNDFKVRDQRGMFGSCDNLTKVNLSDYLHFTTMDSLFWMSPKIESIIIENTALDEVRSTQYMFRNLGENMTDFSFLSDFKNVTNAEGMFYHSTSKHIDLSCFDMSKAENISRMFGYCSHLEQITFPQKAWNHASNCTYFALNSPNLTSTMPPELFWEKNPAFEEYERAFLGAYNTENIISIPKTWKT